MVASTQCCHFWLQTTGWLLNPFGMYQNTKTAALLIAGYHAIVVFLPLESIPDKEVKESHLKVDCVLGMQLVFKDN